MHDLAFFFGLLMTRRFVRCKFVEQTPLLRRVDILRVNGDVGGDEFESVFSFGSMSISSRDIFCWRYVMSALERN